MGKFGFGHELDEWREAAKRANPTGPPLRVTRASWLLGVFTGQLRRPAIAEELNALKSTFWREQDYATIWQSRP